MKIQHSFVHSSFSFINELISISIQNKRIAILAIAAFGLIAACYIAFSYAISRKKDAPEDQTNPLDNLKPPIHSNAEPSPPSLKQNPQPKKDPVLIDLPESPFKPLPLHLSPKTPNPPLSAATSPENRVTHRIDKDKESNTPFEKIEKPAPDFQKPSSDLKQQPITSTLLHTHAIDRVAEQKEERKEIIYLFSPYNDFSSSVEKRLDDSYPGIAEMKASLTKSYQQVVFTDDPQIIKEGAPILFFLNKNPRIQFHNYTVIQMLERLGSNVLVLLFSYGKASREEFKDFLQPESINSGIGKGKVSIEVLEKYRNFDSFLIYEYYTVFSNTGSGEPSLVNLFKGNPNPAQDIVNKLKEMEQRKV